MGHSVALLSSAPGEGHANRVGRHPNHVDTEANKQRRKVQNRKNQRSHHASTSTFTRERAGVLQEPPPAAPVHAQTSLTPPSFIFPLSTYHLLHLVQYNVFRALVSNKRTLNTRVPGRTDNPPSPTTCPLGGHYRDDTTIYSLNPDIPLSLVSTRLRQTHSHSSWINVFPFPCLRDKSTLPLTAGRDEDEVTADRKGLIIWDEPYDKQSWEATPGFLAKWVWAVEECDDLVGSSNRWRLMRGEEPMRLSESKR
ncbi:hypothetical protein EDB80DRAFT_767412 [Ilyonectria destructans]|nr:hypothetical protein EDB80DRAFT_767412 [Ilyonectria destructans]